MSQTETACMKLFVDTDKSSNASIPKINIKLCKDASVFTDSPCILLSSIAHHAISAVVQEMSFHFWIQTKNASQISIVLSLCIDLKQNCFSQPFPTQKNKLYSIIKSPKELK